MVHRKWNFKCRIHTEPFLNYCRLVNFTKKKCMKPSWTRISILQFLYLVYCMIYCSKVEIMPILHCKIRLCFWSFFQLLPRSMHGKHNMLYQTGYIHNTKLFLWTGWIRWKIQTLDYTTKNHFWTFLGGNFTPIF